MAVKQVFIHVTGPAMNEADRFIVEKHYGTMDVYKGRLAERAEAELKELNDLLDAGYFKLSDQVITSSSGQAIVFTLHKPGEAQS